MIRHNKTKLYFNVKRTIWLKGYQNGNHIKPSERNNIFVTS